MSPPADLGVREVGRSSELEAKEGALAAAWESIGCTVTVKLLETYEIRPGG